MLWTFMVQDIDRGHLAEHIELAANNAMINPAWLIHCIGLLHYTINGAQCEHFNLK